MPAAEVAFLPHCWGAAKRRLGGCGPAAELALPQTPERNGSTSCRTHPAPSR